MGFGSLGCKESDTTEATEHGGSDIFILDVHFKNSLIKQTLENFLLHYLLVASLFPFLSSSIIPLELM